MRRHLILLAGVLLSLRLAWPAYVESSFLGTLLKPEYLAWIFALGALLSIAGIEWLTAWLPHFGLRRTNFWLIAGSAASGLLLFSTSPHLALIGFLGFYLNGYLLSFILDVHLESVTANNHTGRARGLFLTLNNLAWLSAPLLIAWLVRGENDYKLMYGLSLVALGAFAIINYRLPAGRISWQKHLTLGETWRSLRQNKNGRGRNLRAILGVDLWLNIFYTTMGIYSPIYLHQTIGFNWAQIGLIFTFMLLPFVLLEYPLGWLADRKLGEKEVMTAGLVLMTLATLAVGLTNSQSVIVWALILFATRVGASALEITKESFLFKQISAGEVNIIGLSRLTPSLARILAPLGATMLLSFFSFPAIFIGLAFSTLTGLIFVARLKDTR